MSKYLSTELKKTLNDLVYTVPYNSIRRILLNKSINIPLKLGGECKFQNLMLEHRLKELGFNSKLIYGIEKSESPHTGNIVSFNNELYFLDTFFMIDTPINISKVLKTGKKQTFNTIPKYQLGKIYFEVEPINSSVFLINNYATLNKETKNILTFKFDLNNPTLEDRFTDYEDHMKFRKQKELILRYTSANNIWSVRLGVNNKNMKIKIFDGKKVQIYDENKIKCGFPKKLSELGIKLGVEGDQIYSLFYQAQEIYNNNQSKRF